VHCSIVDAGANLASCTTTSGLSWKHPGRVGDSPIVGAGIFCDNEVGAAGSTGRGEACLDNCASHAIVSAMARGLSPTDACVETLRTIARRTRRPGLLDEAGRPRFNITLYALRKDGAFGSAAMYSGYSFAVATNDGTWRIPSAFLFERPRRG
jgi:N4-(beta-N-acetylglucosaminyl)-L-asparaginase